MPATLSSPLPAIQGLWIGAALTRLEHLSIRSFLANGHPYRLFAYGEVEGVPDGTCVADAREILPREQIFFSHGSPAHFSDWFRWKLMVQQGGYWADLDVVCLKPFDFSEPVVFGRQDGEIINTAVLRFPAGHPLARTMLRRCETARPVWPGAPADSSSEGSPSDASADFDAASQPWGLVGGPYGFTAEVRRAGLEYAALPASFFYPVPFEAWQDALRPGTRDIEESLAGAFAVHLWNDMLQRHGVDTRAGFPAGSLVGHLERRYLPTR